MKNRAAKCTFPHDCGKNILQVRKLCLNKKELVVHILSVEYKYKRKGMTRSRLHSTLFRPSKGKAYSTSFGHINGHLQELNSTINAPAVFLERGRQ